MSRVVSAVLLASCVGCFAPAPDPRLGPPAPEQSGPALEQAPPPRELVYLAFTPAAEREVLAHMVDIKRDPEVKADRLWFRFEMVPGGCTGFQTKLWIDGVPPTADSFEYRAGGVSCLLLKSQRELVQGTLIDFGSKDGKSGFIVTAPHASTRTKAAVAKWIADESAKRNPDLARPADEK